MNPVCPYCRMMVFPDAADCRVCEGCGVPHHAECYTENGGCTVFGCRFAPVDEPKLSISQPELNATAGLTAAAMAPAPPPSPVPPLPPSVAQAPIRPVRYFIPEPENPDPVATPPPPPAPGVTFSGAAPAILYVPPPVPKKRLTYVLLGIFLGSLGIHNFYAGYAKKGLAQLLISLLTLGYGSVISWIWAVVDVCRVEKDNAGVRFA